MEDAARTDAWRPARMAAGAAGVLLLWRGLFGGRACIVPLLAGAWIVRQALGMRRTSRTWSAGAGGRSRPLDVVEAKSPSELEARPASAPTKAPE